MDSCRLPARRRRTRWVLSVVCVLACAAVNGAGQDPAAGVDPLVTAGKQLLARLDAAPDAMAAVLAEVGDEAARDRLSAVVAFGQRTGATADDWTALHRALDVLITIYEAKGELLRASIYATLQDTSYRNYEQDYESALAASRRTLELTTRSGQTATVYLGWSAIASNLTRLGRLDEAVEALRRAQSLVPDPHSTAAVNLARDLVNAEIGRGRLDLAAAEVTRTLAATEGAPPLVRSRARLARADVLMAEGRHGAALDAIREAQVIAADDPAAVSVQWEASAQVMSVVLAAATSLPFAEAMTLASRAEREFTDLPFAVSPFAQAAIRTRRRLAGDFEALLREDGERLAAARAAGRVVSQIEALRSLAVTYRAGNALQQQTAALEEALDLERTLIPQSGVPANVVAADSFYSQLTVLGDAYLDREEPARAASLYDEALKGIEGLGDAAMRQRVARAYADAYLGRARVTELSGDVDRARELLARALRGEVPAGRFDRVSVLTQAARLERAAGVAPALAASRYEDAVAASHQVRDARREVALRLEAARFLATTPPLLPGALPGAVRHVSEAARAAARLNVADARWRVPFVEGLIAEAQDDRARAIDRYRAAVDRLDEIRASLSQAEQRQAFVDNESVQELYRRLVGLLGASGRYDEAWTYVERGKARAFLEMLHGRRFRPAAPAPELDRLAALEREIVDLWVQLSPGHTDVVRGAGKEPAVLQAHLRRLEQRFAIERQQAGLSRTRAGAALAVSPPSMADIRKRLAPGTALIQYAFVPAGLTAFVVTDRSARAVTWAARDADLTGLIRTLRRMLASPMVSPGLADTLGAVSKALVAPVAGLLPDEIRHLIVVPAGPLTYLPFQVLTLPDGRALIDRFTISYLPSAATMTAPSGARNGAAAGVFLGALGNVAVEDWSPLPGTLAEVDAIVKVYPDAVRVKEHDFTHQRVVQALRGSALVHLATHGFVNEDAPLFSALMMSPAPGQPTRLSLFEIPDLTVAARVVVLSACETGLGRLSRGDEVTGLTRTFLSAGADTVVSSLWEVSDDATAILMEGFYRRLRGGTGPAAALRASALELRQRYPHPFFWAPFIVTGQE